MSQENVEVVRTMVAIFNRTGFLPEALFDPEIELFNIRESPLPGPTADTEVSCSGAKGFSS